MAGGIGLPPLRSLIWNVLDERSCFGNAVPAAPKADEAPRRIVESGSRAILADLPNGTVRCTRSQEGPQSVGGFTPRVMHDRLAPRAVESDGAIGVAKFAALGAGIWGRWH